MCDIYAAFLLKNVEVLSYQREVAHLGDCVSVVEDSGFTNVEQVIKKLLSSLANDIPRPTKIQIKITNLNKRQVQPYQRFFHELYFLGLHID